MREKTKMRRLEGARERLKDDGLLRRCLSMQEENVVRGDKSCYAAAVSKAGQEGSIFVARVAEAPASSHARDIFTCLDNVTT